MKSLLTTLSSVFLIISICFGQASPNKPLPVPRGPEDYLKMVKEFYYHLLTDKKVTLRETFRMFSPYILEEEAFLFEKICQKDPNHRICQQRGLNSTGNSWDRDSPSLYFLELKKNQSYFTMGYEKQLDSILNHCSTVYQEGGAILSIDVTFPNHKTLYFSLNPYLDEPLYITDISFETGKGDISLLDPYCSKAEQSGTSTDGLYWRHAIIEDADGFVNVRSDKGSDAPVIVQIAQNEVFKYSPNFYSPWWRVMVRRGKKTIEGYVHKSRIIPYGNLSAEQKKNIPLPKFL